MFVNKKPNHEGGKITIQKYNPDGSKNGESFEGIYEYNTYKAVLKDKNGNILPDGKYFIKYVGGDKNGDWFNGDLEKGTELVGVLIKGKTTRQVMDTICVEQREGKDLIMQQRNINETGVKFYKNSCYTGEIDDSTYIQGEIKKNEIFDGYYERTKIAGPSKSPFLVYDGKFTFDTKSDKLGKFIKGTRVQYLDNGDVSIETGEFNGQKENEILVKGVRYLKKDGKYTYEKFEVANGNTTSLGEEKMDGWCTLDPCYVNKTNVQKERKRIYLYHKQKDKLNGFDIKKKFWRDGASNMGIFKKENEKVKDGRYAIYYSNMMVPSSDGVMEKIMIKDGLTNIPYETVANEFPHSPIAAYYIGDKRFVMSWNGMFHYFYVNEKQTDLANWCLTRDAIKIKKQQNTNKINISSNIDEIREKCGLPKVVKYKKAGEEGYKYGEMYISENGKIIFDIDTKKAVCGENIEVAYGDNNVYDKAFHGKIKDGYFDYTKPFSKKAPNEHRISKDCGGELGLVVEITNDSPNLKGKFYVPEKGLPNGKYYLTENEFKQRMGGKNPFTEKRVKFNSKVEQKTFNPKELLPKHQKQKEGNQSEEQKKPLKSCLKKTTRKQRNNNQSNTQQQQQQNSFIPSLIKNNTIQSQNIFNTTTNTGNTNDDQQITNDNNNNDDKQEIQNGNKNSSQVVKVKTYDNNDDKGKVNNNKNNGLRFSNFPTIISLGSGTIGVAATTLGSLEWADKIKVFNNKSVAIVIALTGVAITGVAVYFLVENEMMRKYIKEDISESKDKINSNQLYK